MNAVREHRPLRVCMLTVGEYDWHPRVRRQAEALAARGDRVTAVALHSHGRPAEELIDGVNVVRLPVSKYRGGSTKAYLALYGEFAMRAAVWAARRIRRFDVVQVNTMPEALVLAAMPLRLAGVPVLLDVHDRTAELFASKFGRESWLLSAVEMSERLSLRLVNEVLTVHDPYAATLRRLTGKPVSVVMNCPDERLFAPRRWLDWRPDGDVRFGYHGLIARRHGLVEAVEALATLRTRVPGARLRIWGAGDGLNVLRRHTGELGLGGAVHLPDGPVPITQVAAELTEVHIGLVPSLRDTWTDRVLPTKLLEYAAIGIPVISFRNPIIERYFSPDTITYVDPVTPATLCAAMLELAGDPARAREQSRRARAVMDQLTWRQHKAAYLKVIDRVAGGRDG